MKEKYPYLSQYLKKNKMQVRLVTYYSAMSGYIVDMDRRQGGAGPHLASVSGPTLDEALSSLEPVCQALLEAEEGRIWKKTTL